MTRQRFCVFCGNKPKEKTNEHIIPKWLIDLTGDPHREMNIGPLVSQVAFGDKEQAIKKLSFSSFTFPACKRCNEKSGYLEEIVKPVMVSLLSDRAVSAQGLDSLLDWFDKVRVGLWLGYHQYLDKNYWGVNPHFHIKDRIARADRALLIYRAQKGWEGIRFVGINTPAFAHAPSCFTLIVNHLLFINVSQDFLVSKQAGLPHLEWTKFSGNETSYGPLVTGTETLASSLLEFDYDRGCTAVAQPIIPNYLSVQDFDDFYTTECIDDILLSSRRVRPLLDKDGVVSLYPLKPSLTWMPESNVDIEAAYERNFIQTLRIQNYLVEQVSLSEDMSRIRQQFLTVQFSNCIKANDELISRVIHNSPFSSDESFSRKKIPRNALCPCQSGKKYKHCCGRKGRWNV